MPPPFFSIGVPTYNRHELLRETLASILAQGFSDFEVIVGNDYTAEVLTGDMLGITDPRIRIVNHPCNLREVGNMNALLELASGRYFTWLFDDDLYEPDFLQTAHDCLLKSGFPPAFFSSFRMLKPVETFQPALFEHNGTSELSGKEFLNWYSAAHPQIASTSGMFDTAALRTTGGVEELCNSAIGIYCEYLLLVKCALLGRIAFMDAPFYVFRRHADSASENNQDLENHRDAGRELLKRCSEVLHHPILVQDYSENLMKIAEIHLITFAYITSRFEFAQKGHWYGTVCRALRRHWKESMSIKKQYSSLGGDTRLHKNLTFLQTNIFCSYIILRLLAHFSIRSFR